MYPVVYAHDIYVKLNIYVYTNESKQISYN